MSNPIRILVAEDHLVARVGVTTIVTVAVPPEASVPRLQVTVPDASAQVPCVVEAETKFSVAGTTSVTVTPVASFGPKFLTSSV